MNVRNLIVPADRLPNNPLERRAQLDAYFDDLLASVKAVPDGWEIDLNWPSTADYYVDPDVEKGLAWWKEGTHIAEIHRQVNHGSRGQLSLSDAWTLFSWSNWLVERRQSNTTTDEIVILHIDDHTDLMTPRLTVSEDAWWDAISGQAFDLYNPHSVRSAILTGAVGVGSFMSPLLHAVQRVHLRHLSQRAPAGETQHYALDLEAVPDTLLNTTSFRPGIRASCNGGAPRLNPAKDYRFSRHLDSWLRDLPIAPVLLHFDMDYFNNRYDRDSDWKTKGRRHDPELPEVLNAIDAVFKVINEAGVATRIENVTVALSPGFFPSELWALSIKRMQEHLARIGWAISAPNG